MFRSQIDKKPKSSGPVSTKPSVESKKSNLEQAYGSSLPNKIINKPITGTQKPKPSSIVAASKAAYAEKYDPITSRPLKSDVVKSKGTSSTNTTTTKAQPVKSLRDKLPTTKNSRLVAPQLSNTLQQRNKNVVQKKVIKMETKEMDEYEDDFEEEYKSDFEDGGSTDDEGLSEKNEKSLALKSTEAVTTFKTVDKNLDSSSVPETLKNKTQNNLKSNSIHEFEELEQQIFQNEISDQDESEVDENDELSISGDTPGSRKLISNETQTPFPVQGFFSKSNNKNNETNYANAGDGNFAHREPYNNKDVEAGNQMIVSSPAKLQPIATRSKGTFDFVGSQLETEKKARFDRATRLKGMIRFNKVNCQLLHLEPTYEQFMFSFTGTQRIQEGVQTGNNIMEESSQTDLIEMCTKWTQKPPTWSTTNVSNDIRVVRQEAIGVGGDIFPRDKNNEEIGNQLDVANNWEQISKFISRASRKVLYVLESEKRLNLPNGNKPGAEIKMNRGLSILNNLEMGCLTCEGDFIACANGYLSSAVKGAKKHTSKNVITVWSLKEPSSPVYYLRVWGQVNVIHIYTLGHIVAAGNKDGSISLWDLDERTDHHTHYQEQYIRTPSFLTSCMEPTHMDAIVGLSMLSEAKDTTMILSLDRSGTLITWVCIRTKTSILDESLSQFTSAWAKINLTIRHVAKLDEHLNDTLVITAFQAWRDEDSTEFAFSTFNGYTARGLLTGDKTVFQKYSELRDSDSPVTCFDISHTLGVLITGCGDKKCRLYEFAKTKMILVLECDGCPLSVKWSKRRSSVIYIALPNAIEIWDLLVSDMAPWKVISKTNIQQFTTYTSLQREFTVTLASNELKISSMAGDIQPLSQKDHTRLLQFVALLVSPISLNLE